MLFNIIANTLTLKTDPIPIGLTLISYFFREYCFLGRLDFEIGP